MKDNLLKLMTAVLAEETGDPSAAASFANWLLPLVFTFRDATPLPDSIDYIVVAAFGQYRDQHGNASPDRVVNPRLKQLARECWERYRCPGIAQWEVFRADGEPLPSAFTEVNPTLDPVTGSPIYLSTRGVFEGLPVKENSRTACRVLVLAHRLHAYRCVAIARSLGYQAYAPYDRLPTELDPAGSQKWACGPPELYLLHDIISRLNAFRDEQLKSKSTPSASTR